MYNLITAIKDLYHKIIGRQESEETPRETLSPERISRRERLRESLLGFRVLVEYAAMDINTNRGPQRYF